MFGTFLKTWDLLPDPNLPADLLLHPTTLSPSWRNISVRLSLTKILKILVSSSTCPEYRWKPSLIFSPMNAPNLSSSWNLHGKWSDHKPNLWLLPLLSNNSPPYPNLHPTWLWTLIKKVPILPDALNQEERVPVITDPTWNPEMRVLNPPDLTLNLKKVPILQDSLTKEEPVPAISDPTLWPGKRALNSPAALNLWKLQIDQKKGSNSST